MPSHWPGAVMSLQRDLEVVELARDPEEIGGSLLGLFEPAPINIEDPQIGDSWPEVGRARESASNFRGAFDRFGRLRRAPSVNAHQSRAELRQDGQLGTPTLGGFGPSFEK